MRARTLALLLRRPDPRLAWTAAAAVTALWGALRLVVFSPILFPLTYAVPLLLCVWTRSRVMLWCMAGVFTLIQTYKQFWLLRAEPPLETWANYAAALLNIGLAVAIVHVMTMLRDHVERSHAELAAQAEELAEQNEELARQSEELSAQGEELARQNEQLTGVSRELSAQNEGLHVQSQEIQALNAELQHREALLQALLDAIRTAGSEHAALERVCRAAVDLLGAPVAAVMVSERVGQDLLTRAAAGFPDGEVPHTMTAETGIAAIAIEQNRTAAVNDLSLRPDLTIPRGDGSRAFGATLSAPVRGSDGPFGALTLFATGAHEWTARQFRMAEWLADQAAHILQILRLHHELAHTQTALRETDRRKTEFLATLSHELRNPLSAMHFALELLPAETVTMGPSPRAVLQRQLVHLARLVDDLLDLSRIVSNRIRLRPERVDLRVIVRETVASIRREIEAQRHQVTLALPDAPLWIDGDPVRLTQVLANLLTNAARYTPSGGYITVTGASAHGLATLSVVDTGVGLRGDDVRRVFEMFSQVGEPGQGGLGIGLALVREIVELHAGRVDARSDGPGTGSEFRVWLPLAAAPDLRADGTRPARGLPAARRILVVDDNVDAADLLKTLLELDGHEVTVAYDGHDALRSARQEPHDVGLFDIGLPDLDGYELAEALRRDPATAGMFLIALTGWGQPEDREKAFAHGFDAHLTKPATPGAIREQIQSAYVRRRDPAGNRAVRPRQGSDV